MDDLKRTPLNSERLISALKEISEGIVELTPEQSPLRLSVQEIIDIDHIKQQLEQEAIRYEQLHDFIGSIVNILTQVGDDARRNETRAQWVSVISGGILYAQPSDQPKALCDAIRFLLNRVNTMRIDAANARWVDALCST